MLRFLSARLISTNIGKTKTNIGCMREAVEKAQALEQATLKYKIQKMQDEIEEVNKLGEAGFERRDDVTEKVVAFIEGAYKRRLPGDY